MQAHRVAQLKARKTHLLEEIAIEKQFPGGCANHYIMQVLNINRLLGLDRRDGLKKKGKAK